MSLRSRIIFIIICLMVMSIALSVSKGSTSASLYQLLFAKNDEFSTILLQIRIARTAAAFVTGGLLALAGTLLQLLLQNPLADPYVLGISGGAAFFTLVAMVLGLGSFFLVGGAWLGSLMTIFLIFSFSRKHRWQPQGLLLIGVALACGFSAGISTLLLMSPSENLPNMLFWITGDLNDAQFPWLGLVVLVIGLILCYLLAPGLNILSRGDQSARALGLPTQKYRSALYLASSLFTATAVTIAGCVGFVGLVVPHFTRQLIGYDHRYVLPVAMMMGGTLVTLADVLARTLFAPTQLPVGIMMAAIGVPVFIWLLNK